MSDFPEERLPPEERFNLYMKIHERAKQLDADGVAEAAFEQAQEAVRESPQIKGELRELLRRIEAQCDE
jgi:uncharacterized coiled-coil DUF342 family protein